jgi:GT2 family glycosyltransferase
VTGGDDQAVNPLVTFLVPVVANGPDLVATLDSLLVQSDGRWEAILTPVADALIPDHLDYRGGRVRVQPVALTRLAAVNAGAAVARGTWTAILGAGDSLDERAVALIDEAAIDDVDVIYTDELFAGGGEIRKPGWSPARLRNQDYVGRLLVIRRSLLGPDPWLRQEFARVAEYDLALRVTERARRIAHIAFPVYRRPAQQISDSGWVDNAGEGVAALQDHCERSGFTAEVAASAYPGIYRTRLRWDRHPLVSIVIPTRGGTAVVEGRYRTLITGVVRSIVTTTDYPNYEIVVVADQETPASVEAAVRELAGDRLVWVRYDLPFNFSDKVNRGALAATGELLLFLNDDVAVASPDWLDALVSPLADPGVGMTGAMLWFANGAIQHAGHKYDHQNPTHAGWREPRRADRFHGAFLVERECSGVTAACALVPRTVFRAVGGFCPSLAANYNDVDFSLKVRRLGWRIVWTPDAELFHFESLSRASSVTTAERDFVRRRWASELRRDSYWPVAEIPEADNPILTSASWADGVAPGT